MTTLFKIGDIIIWTTRWGSLYLGKVEAKFLDSRGVEILYCLAIGDDFADRDKPFYLWADAENCKIYLGPITKKVEGALPNLPPPTE